MITIYAKGTTDVRAIIDPDDKSQQQCGIMREDIVTLSFSEPEFINFQIGDYAELFGATYQLNLPAEFTKVATRNFQFALTMEGPMYDLRKCVYLFLDANNIFTEAQFSLLGKPIDFLNLIIYNLNRLYPGAGWAVGTCDDGAYQNLTFASQNCLEVLSTLAQTFLTEYRIDGKKISLTIAQPVSGVTLEYGKGQALTSVQQQNAATSSEVNVITRLYAYGSNKNIGSNYRNGAKYLRMAAGLYIEKNVTKLGIFEAVIYFDGTAATPEIYPQRTGVVSAVISDFSFTDADIDFDVNDQLIPGVTAQLTFNTGLLAGYTFDIATFDNATKTFVFNANTSDQTLVIPSDTLKPAVGDTYVLINILMPLAYVNDAEAQLLLNAQQYLNNKGPAQLNFTVGCNPLWFKQTGTVLKLGYTYNLLSIDAGINRQIRLVDFTRNIRKPYLYTNLVLADRVIVQPTIVKLINAI